MAHGRGAGIRQHGRQKQTRRGLLTRLSETNSTAEQLYQAVHIHEEILNRPWWGLVKWVLVERPRIRRVRQMAAKMEADSHVSTD